MEALILVILNDQRCVSPNSRLFLLYLASLRGHFRVEHPQATNCILRSMYVYVKYYLRFFFTRCSPATELFLLALSAAGQASLPWVHYEACLDLGRAPWRRSAR